MCPEYTKLPPRATITVQSIGAILGAVLQYILMKQLIDEHRDIFLSVQGTNIWSGQQVQAANAKSVSWGALAKSMYAPGTPYFIVPIGILIGLLIPLPFWLAHRKYPKLGADRVITPIVRSSRSYQSANDLTLTPFSQLCWALGYLSVGINSSVFTTFLVAIFSQYYLRIHRPTWFRKYNVRSISSHLIHIRDRTTD
jgi:hypothetical protein